MPKLPGPPAPASLTGRREAPPEDVSSILALVSGQEPSKKWERQHGGYKYFCHQTAELLGGEHRIEPLTSVRLSVSVKSMVKMAMEHLPKASGKNVRCFHMLGGMQRTMMPDLAFYASYLAGLLFHPNITQFGEALVIGAITGRQTLKEALPHPPAEGGDRVVLFQGAQTILTKPALTGSECYSAELQGGQHRLTYLMAMLTGALPLTPEAIAWINTSEELEEKLDDKGCVWFARPAGSCSSSYALPGVVELITKYGPNGTERTLDAVLKVMELMKAVDGNGDSLVLRDKHGQNRFHQVACRDILGGEAVSKKIPHRYLNPRLYELLLNALEVDVIVVDQNTRVDMAQLVGLMHGVQARHTSVGLDKFVQFSRTDLGQNLARDGGMEAMKELLFGARVPKLEEAGATLKGLRLEGVDREQQDAWLVATVVQIFLLAARPDLAMRYPLGSATDRSIRGSKMADLTGTGSVIANAFQTVIRDMLPLVDAKDMKECLAASLHVWARKDETTETPASPIYDSTAPRMNFDLFVGTTAWMVRNQPTDPLYTEEVACAFVAWMMGAVKQEKELGRAIKYMNPADRDVLLARKKLSSGRIFDLLDEYSRATDVDEANKSFGSDTVDLALFHALTTASPKKALVPDDGYKLEHAICKHGSFAHEVWTALTQNKKQKTHVPLHYHQVRAIENVLPTKGNARKESDIIHSFLLGAAFLTKKNHVRLMDMHAGNTNPLADHPEDFGTFRDLFAKWRDAHATKEPNLDADKADKGASLALNLPRKESTALGARPPPPDAAPAPPPPPAEPKKRKTQDDGAEPKKRKTQDDGAGPSKRTTQDDGAGPSKRTKATVVPPAGVFAHN